MESSPRKVPPAGCARSPGVRVRTSSLLLALFLPAGFAWSGTAPAVAAKEYTTAASAYRLSKVLNVAVTPEAEAKLRIIANQLKGTDISLRVSPIKEESDLHILKIGAVDHEPKKVEVPPQPEGYLLNVSPQGVILLARSALGIQWGLLRLRHRLDMKGKAIPAVTVRDWPSMSWRAVHLFMPAESEFAAFKRFVDEVLLPHYFNTVVLEINYRFDFQQHPEVSETDSRGAAFVDKVCAFLRSREIRTIPEFNCLGHQSWGQRSCGLLRAYPQLDETPKLSPETKGLYCRSWCPRHPDLTPILYDLWEELLQTFQSEYFHIGMDEVFLIAERECPRCGQATPAEIFRAACLQYHAFFRGAKNEVLMWGDRLLEAKRFRYSRYEASETDTWEALSSLPRDIIICDWHYSAREEYPSIKYFLDEGFRVLACPWREQANVEKLFNYAQRVRTDRFLGFMATTWVTFKELTKAYFEGQGSEKAKGAARCLKLVGKLSWQGKT